MMRLLLERTYSLMVLLFLGLLVWVYSPHARADETFTFVVKKQEEKAKNRWSLSEWLETRDRMRLMDLWLALHSPSPYEFFVGGAYANSSQAAAGGGSGYRIEGAAYASIFGLGGEYQSLSYSGVPDKSWNAQFLLRIFGYHAQGTNITLHAGLRGWDPGRRGAIAGVSTNLYLAKYFGVEGLYRYHFESVPDANPGRSNGSRLEGGAFIDFNFVRVFGGYFSEIERLSTQPDEIKRTGFQFGGKIFF